MTSITIPDGVIVIESGAFSECTNLASVSIPNSVTTIGKLNEEIRGGLHDGVFYGCAGLTSISIPNSVTTLGAMTFAYCTALATVEMPERLDSICASTFNGCSALTTITIPYNVTKIGESAFANCASLPAINLHNGLINIGINAFEGCANLTAVKFPNSLRVISNGAFLNCTALDSVRFGTDLRKIGNSAFMNCSSLAGITSLATTPPIIHASGNTFLNVDKNIPVYVQEGCAAAYQSANGWKDFFNIIETDLDLAIGDATAQQIMARGTMGAIVLDADDGRMVRIYNVQGNLVWQGIGDQRIDMPGSGLYLVAVEGQPTQKVVVK